MRKKTHTIRTDFEFNLLYSASKLNVGVIGGTGVLFRISPIFFVGFYLRGSILSGRDLLWISWSQSSFLRCRRYGVRFDLVEISFGSVDRVVVYGAEGMVFYLIWWRSPLAQFVERLLSVQMVRGFGPSYMKTISFVFLTSPNKCSLLSMRGSQSLYNTPTVESQGLVPGH